MYLVKQELKLTFCHYQCNFCFLFLAVMNSMNGGGSSSSIVAQLTAANQNQHQLHAANSVMITASGRSFMSNPEAAINNGTKTHTIHTGNSLTSTKTIPSTTTNSNAMANNNVNNIITAKKDVNMVPAAGVTQLGHESQMLLRDYVNMPPPPPYPGTNQTPAHQGGVTSAVTKTASLVHATPVHGHSTSNVSVGSSGK